MAFKLCITAVGNDFGNTKTGDPVSDKNFGDGGSNDVRNGNRLRPTSETVDPGKKVRKTI